MTVNNGSVAEDSYPVAQSLFMCIWGGKNEKRLGLG